MLILHVIMQNNDPIRVGTICRQYYWEQYIGPLLAKIPIILLLLVLDGIHNFKFHIFVIFCYCWSSKLEVLGCS